MDISTKKDDFVYENTIFMGDNYPALRLPNYEGKNVLFVNIAECVDDNKVQKIHEFVREDLTVAFKSK